MLSSFVIFTASGKLEILSAGNLHKRSVHRGLENGLLMPSDRQLQHFIVMFLDFK